MDARSRILALRLMEMIGKDPVYAQSLGIEAAWKPHSHAYERIAPQGYKALL